MSSSSPTITSISSQPRAKQDLSKTQHPSLVPQTNTNNNKTGVPQPNNSAVAVKLFQFNQGSRSVHVTRDVDNNDESSSPPRIFHPDNNNNTSISHNRLPSGARPSSAASLFSASAKKKTNSNNNNTVLQQQRPSSSSSVVMISSDAKKKTMNNNNSNRPNTAASMTSVNTTNNNRATSASALYDRYDSKGHYGPECTQKNILHTRHKIQFQYGRIRRLQSSELGELIKVVKKGVKNAGKVLEKEDREKMGDDFVGQDGFGRSSFLKMNSMRRQGGSASASTMGQRADSRNSTQRETNNAEHDHHDDDDDERFGGMMQRKETAAFMGHRVESYDDKNNTNNQNEDFIQNDDDDNDEEEMKNDNEEDDDEIDAAFKSGQLAANKNNGRSNLRSAKPATSTTNRPMTAKVGSSDTSATTVTTATRPLTSSVASRSQQPQQQQPPPRAPSAGVSSQHQQNNNDLSPSMTAQQTAIIKRGGSPTLLALIKENTFRGQTVKLESKYLDNLQKFLSPPPVKNNRQEDENYDHDDIQQQVGSGNTTRSNSPTGATRGNSPHQQNNNNSKTRPSSAISVSSSTNLGSRTRSPLTASILKGFATPSASGRAGAGGDASSGRHGSSRCPGRTAQQQFLIEREKEREREFQNASRPASANHLLPGTRWHNAVDHGEVPPTTALDPAELPRDSRDVKIEGLPEELKFYAIKSNQRRPQSAVSVSSMVAVTTSRHNNNNSKSTSRSSKNQQENESILQLSGQPPPSYFFEEPSLINVHDADAGFSPEAFAKSKNPIFSHLAAPSRFKNPKLVHLGCHPQHPNFNDENINDNNSPETTTPSKQQQHQKMMSMMMSAPGTKEDNNGKSPNISPAQEKMLSAIQKERDMKDSLNSISTHSSGIIDYLHRRKQVCYCRYSSVIKRKMLELDHRRRQQKTTTSSSELESGTF